MPPRPVLILGTEPRVAVPVARSLHRLGVPVDVAGLGDEGHRLRSRAIRSQHRLPGDVRRPWVFEAALRDLVTVHGHDMVVPITDTALCLIAAAYEPLSGRVRMGCPPPEVVRRVLDKDVTLEHAQALEIPIPATHLVPDLAALQALRGGLRFPALVKDRSKTRIHESPYKVKYFGSLAELDREFREDPCLGPRAVLQEYVPGEDIGLGVLVHRGELIAGCQYRSLKDLPITGGLTVLAVTEPIDPVVWRSARDLLRSLRWEGVAMVEFRRDPATGRLTLLEVNGRYWGSAGLAIRAGVDLPRYEWQLAHGEPPEVPPSYRIGLTWRWTAGYVRRWHALICGPAAGPLPRPSRWAELGDLARVFDPRVVSALGHPGDPVPGLAELAHTAGDLARSDLHALARRVIPWALVRFARAGGSTGSP